jgi:hypothetical protein
MCSVAGLDAVERRKKSLPLPCQKSNPGRPARSLITILSEVTILLLIQKIQVSIICPETADLIVSVVLLRFHRHIVGMYLKIGHDHNSFLVLLLDGKVI